MPFLMLLMSFCKHHHYVSCKYTMKLYKIMMVSLLCVSFHAPVGLNGRALTFNGFLPNAGFDASIGVSSGGAG